MMGSRLMQNCAYKKGIAVIEPMVVSFSLYKKQKTMLQTVTSSFHFTSSPVLFLLKTTALFVQRHHFTI
jgi:hypothetical protein